MMPSCQDAEKCHHNFDKGQKCFVKGEAVVGAAREARELNSGNADHMMWTKYLDIPVCQYRQYRHPSFIAFIEGYSDK